MDKIEAAMSGGDVTNPAPPDKTKCDFGLWLYGDENHIKEIVGSQFFTNLDREHTKWHHEYRKIYDILFATKSTKGLFSKLLGKKGIDPMELDKVKYYYVSLKEISEALLKALASSERRISALNESKFH
jgi:hypothetical protein